MRCKLLLFSALICLSFAPQRVSQVSLDFTSRILKEGKYLSVEGAVYFDRNSGQLTTHFTRPFQLTTHFTRPFESVTIVSASGEIKTHDPAANTLVQQNSSLNSSEGSYLWHFLNGTHADMGLARAGYKIASSKSEQGVVITNWVPREGYNSPLAHIELVTEKNLPIFMCFRNAKREALGKMYFSSLAKAGESWYPGRITEIMYTGKRDSTVTTKSYRNPRINGDVDTRYLHYRIPANARIVEE